MSRKISRAYEDYLMCPKLVTRCGLSFEAMGVMFTLISLERSGEPLTMESLLKDCRDGDEIIHNAISELEAAGFVSQLEVC